MDQAKYVGIRFDSVRKAVKDPQFSNRASSTDLQELVRCDSGRIDNRQEACKALGGSYDTLCPLTTLELCVLIR